MKEDTIFQINAIYRDDFRINSYTFGEGEKKCCIVGSTRGNEYQQMYVCSRLIMKFTELEKAGKICPGKQIMVIPCANPYSVNIKKRFWSIDNTDINRMFPGYNEGETTQRIAAGIFENVKDYEFGIQFASFYMPGSFVPHVRMMKTGLENVEYAKQFGLPYVVLHNPRPFDTTTLNYNWQIWETNAFSIYTTDTSSINKKSARQAVDAVLNFLSAQGIIDYKGYEGYRSRVIESRDMISMRTSKAGLFEGKAEAGEYVEKGNLLAVISDVCTGEIKEEIYAPCDGTVAFVHNEALTYQNAAVYKIIAD